MSSTARAQIRHHDESMMRLLPWLLIIGGVIGLVASFVLARDDFQLARQGADFIATCDFGSLLSCTDVMQSDQASVFGFPNPFIGLMAYPVVITVGVVMLGRARLAGWIWAGLQVGVTLAVVFITWLQYQTIYDIRALCPWCIVVWAVTIPVFVHVTAASLRQWWPGRAVTRVVSDWHLLIVALWYIVIATAIVFEFFL